MLERPQREAFNNHPYGGAYAYRRAVYRTLDLALAEARHAWDYGTAHDFAHAARLAFRLSTEISLRRSEKFSDEKIERALGEIERMGRVNTRTVQVTAFEAVHFPEWPSFGDMLPERWNLKPAW